MDTVVYDARLLKRRLWSLIIHGQHPTCSELHVSHTEDNEKIILQCWNCKGYPCWAWNKKFAGFLHYPTGVKVIWKGKNGCTDIVLK